MKSCLPLSLPALATLLTAVQAAPAPPSWPTALPTGNPWAWHGGGPPESWPVPSWAKSCYSPTATASASGSAVSSASGASATVSSGRSASVTGVSASSSGTATSSIVATGTTGTSGAGSATGAPTAVIKNGTVVGVKAAEYAQDYFLGVPYAQPPINDLRFRAPQSINSSFAGGSYAADQISPECIGYGSDQWPYAISEDCLYLNIIRPSNYSAYNEPLPVAFWIHGGGYSEGGNADQRYNMSKIVQNGVDIGRPFIAVQVNYRLSAWGFLFGDQVAGEGATNLGLRDQRLGLHWINENIAAFGGDASQVTIWGESAGASSVGFQLVAYGGRNDSLITRAIMESGNSVSYSPLRGSDYYQPKYNAIVNATGCSQAIDTLDCLRHVSFSTINAAINTTNATTWFPTVDGDFIQRYPSIQLAKGDFLHVPIISGANSDEGISFGPRGLNTSDQFVAALEAGTISPGPALPSALAVQLAQTYLSTNICQTPPLTLNTATTCPAAPASLGAIYRFTSAYAGDGVFIANRRLQCQTWAAAGLDAYCYRFNAQPYGNTIYSGVPHFQEIAFVFDNTLGIGYAPAAPDPFTNKPSSFFSLADLMSKSWASFISSGSPNNWAGQEAYGSALWPAYSVEDPMNIVWDANVTSLAYAESDTWRAEGIQLINEFNVAFQR